MKLASFDIFDTTLIRKCGKPENVFYLLAHQLYPNDKAKCNDFVAWRIRAGILTSIRINKIESSLEEIYSDEGIVGFNEYTKQELIAAEQEVEEKNLIANIAIQTLIKKKRAEGYAIAFISDMYFDSKFLSQILQKEGCFKEGDRLFVSCEYQARKDIGSLYVRVKQELSPLEWTHYGDNCYSDVKMAKRIGIHAVHIDTSYTPVEKLLIKNAELFHDKYQLSILAGISRAARFRKGNDAFSVLAADYVASAYIPYVKYILRDAYEKGIRRLYFLSRDSYILMRIAEQLPHEGIELRYLFVSRRSLYCPYLYGGTESDYMKIVDGHTLIGRSVTHMLWQLLLTREELEKRYGISFDYERIISAERERDFLDKLFHSDFTRDFQNRALKEYQLVLDYFRQEGLMNDELCAMVDVGWLGTSRLMINCILQRAGYRSVEFYYCGVRKDVFNSLYGKYVTYYSVGKLTTNATSLIENYYSASPYPTTIGYHYNAKGEIEPLFPEGKRIEETSIVRNNVSHCEWMAKQIQQMHIDNNEILFRWSNITVDVLANLRFPDDLRPFLSVGQFDDSEFVHRLNCGELFNLIFFGKRQTAFDHASLQLTCGSILTRPLWFLHRQSAKISGFLFRKMLQ